MLTGKKVILGISGGIAAYKAAYLIRLFRKAGAEVKVVGTTNAFEFITRVTLESLSEHKVYHQVFGDQNDYTTEHVSLTDWGDVFVVAPATANVIGKLANGIADDALSTSLLAFDRQVFIAPAMNCKMYAHWAVQENIGRLREKGVQIIDPTEGYLACGYEGKGRMEEPEAIFAKIKSYLTHPDLSLHNKKILITAGPTREAIDPVRYLGNHSSGKMGFALAEELAARGAGIHLISGPTHLQTKSANINLVRVTTAEEMLNACMKYYPGVDAAIMAAAVSDYKPAKIHPHKIKKNSQDSPLHIELQPTTDILARMGAEKKQQLLVGFALETDHEETNAIKKLKEKHLDFIVLNSLGDEGAGFAHDTNKISIIDNKHEIFRYPLQTKKATALEIANMVEKHL
ncbi:MAG: bifunctional phosphopantothenoylcysteine decarboxylase/phosphopantothenate--cysteine ligase CoaBC [Bacteroidales bacterium]